LHRVWATTHVENLASARVLEKCGFQSEGCLREDKVYKDARHSSLIFGLLAAEWRARDR
jgi:RimJ/RimL family protein N-acetyltransferase